MFLLASSKLLILKNLPVTSLDLDPEFTYRKTFNKISKFYHIGVLKHFPARMNRKRVLENWLMEVVM